MTLAEIESIVSTAAILQWAGAAILVAGLLQALLLVASSARRIGFEGDQRRLSLDLLRERVSAATAERRRVQLTSEATWNGVRKFEIRRKIMEGGDICSFYLAPHDGKKLAPFHPGQYLTFQLRIPGQSKQTVRCYSLSDCFREDHYRVSIKKCLPPRDKPDAPPGLSSCYFHDALNEGDILDVKAPGGHFFLDLTKQTPVVLIGGGIGLTPVLSMLNAIVESGSTRETWFFYGVRNGREHVMREHLERLEREHENVRLRVCYSNPADGEEQGKDYHHAERVSVELLKRLLPSSNYEYYICGPGPMMTSLTEGLRDWGVPTDHVHFEAFGPASVKKQPTPAQDGKDVSKSTINVTFARSGKTICWTPTSGSLLDFAEASGVAIDSGCRAGNCGTCLVAVKSGEVTYVNEPGEKPEPGTCLTCISAPAGDLEIDA
jgi:hypothetical protein